MKIKKSVLKILTAIIIFILIFLIAFGNPMVSINNKKLKNSITSLPLEKETVKVNEVVPFKWDVVYTFAPYTPKEEIEQIIGFKSRSIEVGVSESMMQLIFVKDSKIVSSVCGYSGNLGYSIDFFDKSDSTYSKIYYKDNTVFSVDRKDGIVNLSYIE